MTMKLNWFFNLMYCATSSNFSILIRDRWSIKIPLQNSAFWVQSLLFIPLLPSVSNQEKMFARRFGFSIFTRTIKIQRPGGKFLWNLSFCATFLTARNYQSSNYLKDNSENCSSTAQFFIHVWTSSGKKGRNDEMENRKTTSSLS